MWSVREQRLYWIDIDGRSVHRFDPATGLDEQRPVPGRPGSIALTGTAGRLLVASEHRLAFLDWSSGTWGEWVELEPAGTDNRLNDGRCDPRGRFWVGSMFDPAAAGRFSGLLHRVDPDGTARTVRGEIGVANGLAFSPDGGTMYFADTLRDTVWAYDYDPTTGEPTNERVFLDFTSLPGRPDGACVDADGCYWVACIHAGVVIRVTPAGAVDQRVALPVPKPTMPAFGGPTLSTLFITTIGGGGSHERDPNVPDAGGLFAIETDVQGVAEPAFGAALAATPQ